MKLINEMIVALYKREQRSMQNSEGNARLFIAKLVFCLLIWIWFLPIQMLIERNFRNIDVIYNIPRGRGSAFVILLIIYFPLHFFTWKLKEVDSYLADEENEESIKKAKRLFFLLLVLGFVFLIAVAKYNQYNPISD
jgi:phosphoglycerol transferase MdoB-like AlkP superfamily enzyme